MNLADIKDLFERKARAMTKRPSFARGLGHASARLEEGFACRVELGDRTLASDLPAEDGGGGTAVQPGQLMRASVAACLAMGYRLWAARLDVAIDGVSVDLTCEYDARGQMGLADVAVGCQRMVVAVVITSDAPEADLRRVVETADRLSTMLANLSAGIERVQHLTIVRPAASPAVSS